MMNISNPMIISSFLQLKHIISVVCLAKKENNSYFTKDLDMDKENKLIHYKNEEGKVSVNTRFCKANAKHKMEPSSMHRMK